MFFPSAFMAEIIAYGDEHCLNGRLLALIAVIRLVPRNHELSRLGGITVIQSNEQYNKGNSVFSTNRKASLMSFFCLSLSTERFFC